MIDASAYAIAEVERELAEMDAAAAAVEANLEQRHRSREKVSCSFSVRMDTGELAAEAQDGIEREAGSDDGEHGQDGEAKHQLAGDAKAQAGGGWSLRRSFLVPRPPP